MKTRESWSQRSGRLPLSFCHTKPDVKYPVGCLLVKRNVNLWITRWKPVLLCGGFSQSHRTSIKVLVKCLSDFFIIHLEALRLARDQKWHGSLLKDLYTYATAIPEWCQGNKNETKNTFLQWDTTERGTSAWDTKFRLSWWSLTNSAHNLEHISSNGQGPVLLI